MAETLHKLEAGEIVPTSQDDAQATLAPILRKEDGRINFTRPASEIFDRLRGFQPWPGAYTTIKGKTLQIHKSKPVTYAGRLGPGEIAADGAQLVVGCGGSTTLELLEVQLEGKRRVLAREFINGYKPQSGDHLGQ
jgi:methionyl-tRNA formyltransferase